MSILVKKIPKIPILVKFVENSGFGSKFTKMLILVIFKENIDWSQIFQKDFNFRQNFQKFRLW